MKTKSSKGIVTAMMAVAVLVGVGGGALLNSNSQAHAATTTTPAVAAQTTTDTSNSTVNSTAPANTGTFKSNEDPTHEKTESAAREAQEDAGQQPTGQ